MCSLAVQYDNLIPFPTRFLVPIDCFKIQAQERRIPVYVGQEREGRKRYKVVQRRVSVESKRRGGLV